MTHHPTLYALLVFTASVAQSETPPDAGTYATRRQMVFPGQEKPTAKPAAATADSEFSKNGLPCVKEVCLGDGLAELKKVKWDRASSFAPMPGVKVPFTGDMQVTPAVSENVAARFRGYPAAAIPYLFDSTFDTTGLPALASVTAACQYHQLRGKFTTVSGNPTEVSIALLPTPIRGTALAQRWTVFEIGRTIPQATSLPDLEAVSREMNARYQRWNSTGRGGGTPRAGEAYFLGQQNQFTLRLSLGEDNALRRIQSHPACIGPKAKID